MLNSPLWKLLVDTAKTGAGKPSAEAVRAAVGADPGAAARPFATPAGWKPVEGALVRLRPGLGEKEGLRAGELATVTRVFTYVNRGGGSHVKRLGEDEAIEDILAADLAPGFDGWLPLHAAAYLVLDKEALLLLLEAHPAAATTADAGGKYPLEVLPPGASDDAATLLFKASGKVARPLWEKRTPRTGDSRCRGFRDTRKPQAPE